MRITRVVGLPLMLIAACKGKQPTTAEGSAAASTTPVGSAGSSAGSAASPGSAAGSGSADGSATGSGSAAGSGSADGSATGSGSAMPAGCNLEGDYRVRGAGNEESDGDWLRFRVAGTPPVATILNQQTLLGLNASAIKTVADVAHCQLTITAKSTFGTGEIALTLDPKTNAVTGKATVTEHKRPPATIVARGVRGATTIAAADACFAPGVYVLQLDPKHPWRAPPDEQCINPIVDIAKHYLRVEWLGDALVVDQVEGKETLLAGAKPWQPWTSKETAKRVGPCEIELTLDSRELKMKGKLRFANNAVTGTMATVDANGVEGGDEAENAWRCQATNLPVTAKRVATPDWGD